MESSVSREDHQILILKENDEDKTENTLNKVRSLFTNHNDEHCSNDNQMSTDEPNESANNFNNKQQSDHVSNNEEKENEDEKQQNLISKLNDKQLNDIQMEDEDNQLNENPLIDESSDQQPCSPMEDENECMKRRIRLRNDLNKRKLRHLQNNKRRADEEENKHLRTDEDSLDDEEEELNEDEINKQFKSNIEQSTNQNIVDLLTKHRTDADNELNEDNPNEDDNIKKATAYLELQKLIQLLQQQQSNNQETSNHDEDNLDQQETIENVEKLSDNQTDNQQSSSINQLQPEQPANKEWLLNAASATFPLEKSQCEALAKQSPALLHQQLMIVQLLQQFQQQAVNETTNDEERGLNELERLGQFEKNRQRTLKDEPMDCDKQSRSLFDLQKSTNNCIDNLNKSKFNFGNLISPTNTSSNQQSAPAPTRSASTINPISKSSSLFTSNSSINSINNQLNRLNPLQQNSSNLNRSNPIDNLILMPDDLPTGDEPSAPSKNPLELLQHTAEKAIQKTMKGRSFLVNGDSENSENNSDDPANRHRCKFCEKVFGSDSAMQIHIRSHTGERPFKCNVCGNRFSTKGNLKVHFSRHQTKYPHIKMNSNPIPEHMDKLYPPLEPPGSSQSPPPQYQPEDDLLAVNNIGLNFAHGLAAAAAASQHTLTQQKQRQQLQDINLLAANLSVDRLDSFSRELLLANSNNFLLKNSSSASLNEKQLKELASLSRSPAAAKQETNELDDSSIQETIMDNNYKQKQTINNSNESMDVLTDSFLKSTANSVLNQLNQNIPVTSSSASSSINQQQSTVARSSSPTFGQLNNNTISSATTNKENDSSDNYSIMLDYLLKSKQQRKTGNNSIEQSQDNQIDLNGKSSVNALLNELTQQRQQPFNPNLAAQAVAAQAVSSLFSFLPSNLQPNIYQQLPTYLSQLLQNQLPFSAQQQLNNNSTNSSSSQIDNATVANLLQTRSTDNSSPINHSLENNNSEQLSNQTNNNQNNNNCNLIKNSSSSPNHNQSPGSIQQNLLGNVLNNLTNSSMAARSTGGRNSPNSSLNSNHDFDLNSVLSSSPRNSPNLRQLSHLAALTATNSSNQPHHQSLITSPAQSLIGNVTPNQVNSNMNAYQDLLPKPGSTDNAWESLMEVEKDSEAAKIKKLVENCEQRITDPNQCVICQRILSCKSALQMHWRTHTGERPFKCKLCQRAFTTKGNLKTHMSVHRQKPSLRSMHECLVCRQQFTNALVLQQHVKQHHNQPDERQLIQAHQKAQHQLQCAAAMERMLMVVHQQKTGENLGLPANFNFADDPFFANLQNPNFNLAQLQAQLQNSMDRQSIDENSFEAAQQFLNQNGRLSDAFKQQLNDESKQFDEDDFDDTMNDSKELNEDEEDLAIDEIDQEDVANESEDENDEVVANKQKQQKNENDNSEISNLSPNNSLNQQQQNLLKQNEQIHNMNEDSIASTISSSAGALDLTPKQQQVMAAHLQQLNSNINNSQSSGSPGSSNQLLNIQNMPPFQLSARGANTTCRICMKTFACASALTIHYRSHSKERPFKCQICERGFSTKGNMKQHLLTHKIRDFPPDVLGPNLNVSGNNQLSSLMLKAAASVMNGNSASSHHHQNLANNSLSSNNSNHYSSNEQSLITNKTSDLNGLKEKLDLAGVINAVNGSAENCLLKSSSSTLNSNHPTSKSRILQQQSQQLNGDYQSDASCETNEADEHRRSVNSLNGSLNQFERSSIVNSGNESSTSSLLNNNDLKRIGNLTNSISSNLANSLNSANGAAASTSSMVASSNSNGQSGELKHMCEICVKPFSSHSALQIHNRTHTGDKPFKCNICGRPFTTKGNLKVHMGTHMGTHMFSPQQTSRRGRRMSIEMNFPNFMMESNNWIG